MGVVLVLLDITQHQPSQLCIQEADHRAWVDGDNNWKMPLELGGGGCGHNRTVQENAMGIICRWEKMSANLSAVHW